MNTNQTSHSSGFTWAGVDHFVRGAHGIIPRRVSRRLYDEMSEQERAVASMCAGVEARRTGRHIRSLEIAFRILRDDGFPVAWAVFRGLRKVHPTQTVPVGTDEVRILRWDIPEDTAPLRLLFPTHAEVEVVSISIHPGRTGDGVFPETSFRTGCKRWLVHGDSITQGANVTSPDFTWIEQVARTLPLNPWNFGFGGNARAQEVIARDIARRNDWEILSIHIGANSIGNTTPQAYELAYGAFLDVIRSAHPHKTIICATPILHFSDLPGGDNSAEGIRTAIRSAIASRKPVDSNLHILEGRSLLNNPDGFLADGVHPSDHGASEIAGNLSSHLAEYC